jgi:hypothetical protein
MLTRTFEHMHHIVPGFLQKHPPSNGLTLSLAIAMNQLTMTMASMTMPSASMTMPSSSAPLSEHWNKTSAVNGSSCKDKNIMLMSDDMTMLTAIDGLSHCMTTRM